MKEESLKAWHPYLKEESNKEYFLKLRARITEEYKSYAIYPKPSDWFRAFELTVPSEVKVVIVGQDPYPNATADGLAFSTKDDKTPYSLRVIFREIDRDIYHTNDYEDYSKLFPHNRLDYWAKQGVLLINPILTVRANNPKSHEKLGWENFTSVPLAHLYNSSTPRVFMTWGAAAKEHLHTAISPYKWDCPHLFLEAGHPASGAHDKDKFSGCGHFSKANHFLKQRNIQPINWITNEEYKGTEAKAHSCASTH
jgi:uracil-DNA glycosylase